MTDKKIDCHSIDELSISEDSKRALKKQNYSNLEDLLSIMVHMPNALKTYLADLGLNYDDVKREIYCILPEENIRKMEEYEKSPFDCNWGALPPDKK